MIIENSYLMHYGTPRHSGRYPWGSGENPYQGEDFSYSAYTKQFKNEGKTETEIAKSLGINTAQLRAAISKESQKEKAAMTSRAIRLKEKGYSGRAAADIMGINESTYRSLIANKEKADKTKIDNTADVLKKQLEKNDAIDIGVGVERYMGISRTALKNSVESLKEEGYKVYYYPVEQMGTNNKTSVMTLVKGDTAYSDISRDISKIKLPVDYHSEDGGNTFETLEPPKNIDWSRVSVRYAEEGGIDKDGVMELRRGVDDLNLGTSQYAQVRIGVGGTHYLKGMAIYSDNIPEGKDIVFNTNKHLGTAYEDVLKPQKLDEDNPFGATYTQQHYIDKDGNKQLSALNIVNKEGDWGEWSKSLSSQMLSKQSVELADQQLKRAVESKTQELSDIMELTNPIVKETLLTKFADGTDAAAVDLKAAALPRQASHVILPIPTMKDTEIYAPNYKDGESVVLIRYPHGGLFEIPELTVNNRQEEANAVMHNAKDAVGISPRVAEQLSGADFDGDTVLVIPNNSGKIKGAKSVSSDSPLLKLKTFDPKEQYKYTDENGEYPYKIMKKEDKGFHMGSVSNLITDMTLLGASDDEIARAVRHSMVVIDAPKHKLNYEQSYEDNGIAELKTKYQGGKNRGAATLISKASGQARIPIEGEFYVDKNGKTQQRTLQTTKMAITKDPYDLSSGSAMEDVYAQYVIQVRNLGTAAREAVNNVGSISYSKEAAKTYSQEVASLNAKLNTALKNAPLERQAQIVANTIVKQKVQARKGTDDELRGKELQTVKGQALIKARADVGAHKTKVDITDKEWEAIQKGAISSSKVKQIFNNTDATRLKELATPRKKTTITNAMSSRARSMYNSGRYSYADIAEALGVSATTVRKEILGE